MTNFRLLVGTTNWGAQDPHELIYLTRYCSPVYVLCDSSHFCPFIKANLVLEKFNKNLGFGQTLDPPSPLVGPNAQLFPKDKFDGTPYSRDLLGASHLTSPQATGQEEVMQVKSPPIHP